MANISETSINRPVLSTVMMLVILLFGFIGYRFLGVREFPSVDQPIISVNVSYPGAVGAEYQRYPGYPFIE